MSVPIHITGHSGRPEIAISTAAGVVTLSLTCLTRKVPRSFTPPRLSVLQGQMGMRPWRATVCGQVCARAVETKQTNTREATKRTVLYGIHKHYAVVHGHAQRQQTRASMRRCGPGIRLYPGSGISWPRWGLLLPSPHHLRYLTIFPDSPKLRVASLAPMSNEIALSMQPSCHVTAWDFPNLGMLSPMIIREKPLSTVQMGNALRRDDHWHRFITSSTLQASDTLLK